MLSPQQFSVTVHPHHQPLELWNMLWGHGDVLSRPPFKDSLPSCWKCCQWATLNHQPLWGQPLCNDPSRGRYKGLVIGHVRTTLKSHLHSELPWGHLRSPGQCSSLIFASALSLLIPPMLMLGAPLINIPVLNSIWVQPREPICNQYKKNPSIWGGFLFDNYYVFTYL